ARHLGEGDHLRVVRDRARLRDAVRVRIQDPRPARLPGGARDDGVVGEYPRPPAGADRPPAAAVPRRGPGEAGPVRAAGSPDTARGGIARYLVGPRVTQDASWQQATSGPAAAPTRPSSVRTSTPVSAPS